MRPPVPTAQNSIISWFISTFKRFCNKEYGENIWQSRTYDHIVRDSEDYEAYMCEMNMDEDEYARMVQGERRECPYYKRGDEYFIVRKQM